MAIASPTPARAQTPADVVLTGRTPRARPGASGRGARIAIERGPRALAASTGAFQLRGVPSGRHRLEVSRFGYATRELDVLVTDPPAPLDLSLEPRPIALEGVGARGRNEV